MRGRGLYVALGIFAAAVLLYYLVEVQKVGSPATQVSPTASPSPMTTLRASEVDRLVIKSTATSKQLIVTRTGTAWTYAVCGTDQSDCPGQPADPIRALLLVGQVVNLRPDRVVFGAPAGLATYGVDKATTGEIDFTAKSASHTLLVGSKPADGTSYWARLDQSPDVLVLSSTLVDTALLGAISSPPAPLPSPSPSPSGAATSPSPAAASPTPSP